MAETPDPMEQVEIHNPDLSGETVVVTRQAFEGAWKELGYKLGPKKTAAASPKES